MNRKEIRQVLFIIHNNVLFFGCSKLMSFYLFRKQCFRAIEKRVQQPLIHGDIAVTRGFEQPIGRDAVVASRLENQIRTYQESTLVLSLP